MMTYFLAPVARELFAVDRDAVVGILGGPGRQVSMRQVGSRLVIPVSGGREATVIDLAATLADAAAARMPARYFCVVDHQGSLLALAMHGRGRLAMADPGQGRILAPIFGAKTDHLVSRILINGSDLLQILNPDALAALAGASGND